jgi:hypothetical protein
LAELLGKTRWELMANMPDGAELTEWMAYKEGESRVQALIAKGTDVKLALDLVWGASQKDAGG